MNNATIPKCVFYPYTTLKPFQKVQLVVLLLMLAACLFGNILVTTAISRTRKLRTAPNFLVINLSICDMMTAVCAIPFTLIVYNIYCGSQSYPYGEIGCKLLWPITTYASNCSVFTLAAIAVERYLYISAINIKFTKRVSLVALLIIHFLAVVAVIPYIMKLKYVLSEEEVVCYEEWGDEWQMKAYTISLFVIQYALPLIIMAIFYFLAWRTLYIHNNSVIKMSEEYEKRMDWQEQYSSCISNTTLPKHISTMTKKESVPPKKTRQLCNIARQLFQRGNTMTSENKAQYRSQNTFISEQKVTYQRKTSTLSFSHKSKRLHNTENIRESKRFCKSSYLSQTSYVRRRQSIRMLKMFTVVVIVFACFALPNQLTWFLHDFSSLPENTSDIFILLTYVSSVTNCWIYGGFHNGIRKAYIHTICCLCCHRKYKRQRHSTTISTTPSFSLYDNRQNGLFRQRTLSFNLMFEKVTIETNKDSYETVSRIDGTEE